MSKSFGVVVRLFVLLPVGCIVGRWIKSAVRSGLNNAPGTAILFWCTTGGVIGAVIHRRSGYSSFIGFVGGAFLGPVFAWLFLLDKSMRHRRCPLCSERIRLDAKLCQFCQREVPPPETEDRQGPDRLAELRRSLAKLTPYVYVTWVLIGINVLVFVLMANSAVPYHPTIPDLVRWGANFGPMTIGGEWWRLLTCTFIHIGIDHLFLNMLLLAVVGPLVERMVGNVGFLVLYVLAGLCGSLASLFWNPVLVAAGASGAIFGVYGALLALLLRRFGSVRARNTARLWLSGLALLAYNLLGGMVMPDVDSAAHVGGLAGGIVFGILLNRPLTAESKARRRDRIIRVAGFGTILVLAGMLGVYLWHPNLAKVYGELESFEAVEKKVLDMYDEAVARSKRQELSDWAIADFLERDVIPDWRAARNRLSAVKPIPTAYRARVTHVLEYMRLRQEAWEFLAEGMRSDDVQEQKQYLAKSKLADAAARRLANGAGK